MLKVITAATLAITVSALALTVAVAPTPALARDGGAIAAGVVGGLAVGAIIGSQANRGYRDDGYRDGGYRQRAYYNNCRIERRDYEDRYGRLRVRTVRVCD